MVKRTASVLLIGFGLCWAGAYVSSVSSEGIEIKLEGPSDFGVLASHTEMDLSSIFPDAWIIGEHGGPALPMYRLIVGVPPQGEVSFDYSLGSARSLEGVRLKEFRAPGIGEEPAPDLFWADELDPVSYHLTRWRGYRVAVIEVIPLHYQHRTRKLTLYDGASFNLTFSDPTPSFLPPPANDPALPIYQATLINYEQCKNWRLAVPEPAPNPFRVSSNWLKVTLEEEGVYEIDFRDLKRAGIDPRNIDPRSFRLLYAGPRSPVDSFPDTLSELPLYVHGEADGSFDRSDYMVFFARGADRWDFERRAFTVNPFSEENVYWLVWGGEDGKRISTQAAYPLSGDADTAATSILHFEEDRVCPGRSGFLWLWEGIKKTTVTARDTFNLDLSGITHIDTFTLRAYTTTQEAKFRILVDEDILYTREIAYGGNSPPPYHLDSLDVPLADEWEVVIEVSGPADQNLYPDWFRLVAERKLTLKYGPFWSILSGQETYRLEGLRSTPFIFDVTESHQPVLLTDWRVERGELFLSPRQGNDRIVWFSQKRDLLSPQLESLDPGGLWDEDWAFDYLILSTNDNFKAAQELADYRSSTLKLSGVASPKVKAVPIDDIVRDFGYGLAEPYAVRHFLSYAYHKGDGRPFYALILGDGTYDYKNNLGYSSRPEYFLIHTSDTVVDPNVYTPRGAVKEGWFVDFDPGRWFYPEMSISRITARNPREAYAALDKIKGYEQAPREDWSTRVLLLADDDFESSPSEPDLITNHVPACEGLARFLSPEFDPLKVYLSDYDLVAGVKPDAKAALVDALNQGSLLWFFFGHGNGSQLTHQKVFLNTDVPKLHNKRKLPVAMFCSCGIGRFEDTRWECVAEELQRYEEGGVIAAIAATKATGGGSNEELADSLVRAFRNMGNLNVGDLFFAMGYGSGSSGEPRKDPLYIMLGEPGVPLSFPTHRGLDSTSHTFLTADTAVVSFTAPQGAQNWYSSAYGTWFSKRTSIHNIGYQAKGELLYRAAGKLEGSEQTLRFVVPRDIVQGDSAYWQVLVVGGDSSYTYRSDSVGVLQQSYTGDDFQGPQARLFIEGRQIQDGDTVTPYFDLTVELKDPSGINLTGIPGLEGDSLSLVIGNQTYNLSNYFAYHSSDGGVASMGTATIPIELSSEETSLTLFAVDNLLNQEEYHYTLHTSFIDELGITEPLVYPNPVSATADFTFELNLPSQVTVQLFTVSGRLVRRLPGVSYASGFGTYPWDGLDASGRPLPNGVYIYRLSAESEDPRLPNARAAVTGKFIVVH